MPQPIPNTFHSADKNYLHFSTLILCHKHELLNQLENCYDPSLCLHLVALTIFTVVTQNMLHASGKYVSSILRFLQAYLNPEQGEILRNYHGTYNYSKDVEEEGRILLILTFTFESPFTDLVLKLLTLPPDSEEIIGVTSQLDEKLAAVKEVAKTFKKPGVTQAE